MGDTVAKTAGHQVSGTSTRARTRRSAIGLLTPGARATTRNASTDRRETAAREYSPTRNHSTGSDPTSGCEGPTGKGQAPIGERPALGDDRPTGSQRVPRAHHSAGSPRAERPALPPLPEIWAASSV